MNLISRSLGGNADVKALKSVNLKRGFLTPPLNFDALIGLQQTNSWMKYFQKLNKDFSLALTIWYQLLQTQRLCGMDLVSTDDSEGWQVPRSFTASVTSSVCGEFVMGDCLSGNINRHLPSSQWRYKLPLMQIFTEHMKEIHFLAQRPHTDMFRKKLERLALPRRSSVQEGEENRQTWPSFSALLCCSLGILST